MVCMLCISMSCWTVICSLSSRSPFACCDCLSIVICFLKGTSSIDSVPRDGVSRDPLLGLLTCVVISLEWRGSWANCFANELDLRRLGPPIEDDRYDSRSRCLEILPKQRTLMGKTSCENVAMSFLAVVSAKSGLFHNRVINTRRTLAVVTYLWTVRAPRSVLARD